MHQPESALQTEQNMFHPFRIQNFVLVFILVRLGVLVAHSLLDVGLFLGFCLTFNWICLHCLDARPPTPSACGCAQSDSATGTSGTMFVAILPYVSRVLTYPSCQKLYQHKMQP